jgi:RND family efflux transporter MFP subunit
LEKAGSTAEDIEVAEAALGKAQAIVEGLQSQLRQSSIVSPYAGVVTSMNVKVGEVYVPGISASEGVSIIGNGSFEIDVYVPEIDIGKIHAADSAAVTFDAFGSSTMFPAHVKLVDPAETVQNGVNAYKVTVSFDDQTDNRIKSGLTANVIITTKTVSGALVVPTRAIISRGDNKIVLVRDANDPAYSEKQVGTGVVSADGYTEIVSGLKEGDTIAGFGSGL